MEGSDDNASEATSRWTCGACGCNTNTESDRNCTICGTSNGSSLLRRQGYAVRPDLFARSLAARRRFMQEELGLDGYELWERMEEDAEIHDEEDEHAIASLALQVAGVARGGRGRESSNARRRSVIDAARSFAMATARELDPSEILRAACDNGSLYQPKWMNPSQIGGRMRTGNGIEVGEGENQNVAHLPLGAGEGRALRALEAIPRSAPFASFNMAASNESERERRPRRTFGFRVAFEHPTKEEKGANMGGCYLIGVTTTSFAAFSERNSLQQSPFFWGIEDGGNKYEGSRGHAPREGRRSQSSYAIELDPDEVPRNENDVLFGCRDVITCVADVESRTLTFWRDDELMGTLVTNLPGGNLYPVVVPYNAGATVAITGMSGDPLTLLRTYATDWKQARQEKDAKLRQKLLTQRSVFVKDGNMTPEVEDVLGDIFASYSRSKSPSLNEIEASRLWYQCGMKLASLQEILERKKDVSTIEFKDFLNLLKMVIQDEEESLGGQEPYVRASTIFQAGDKVELVEGYERFGDATNGPLQPGDRGRVVDFQEGPNGEKHSVRVIHNSRRWWYQPQALVREKSGLIDGPGVWYLSKILRVHGYDHRSLQCLMGESLTVSSWQVGDVVVPKERGKNQEKIDLYRGQIVAQSSDSTSSLTARGRESGSVNLRYISDDFAKAVGLQTAQGRDHSPSIDFKRVPITQLLHSSNQLKSCTSHSEGRKEDYNSVNVSKRITGDVKRIPSLDVTAIEKVTNECKNNSVALAGLFSAGLTDAVLEAIDCVAKNVAQITEDDKSAQALVALGRLGVTIAQCLFPENFIGIKSNVATRGLSRSPKDERDSVRDQPSIRTRRQLRGAVQPNSNSSSAANRSSSLSSERRRSLFLTMVSRARQNSDTPRGNIMLPLDQMGQGASLLFGPPSEWNNFPAADEDDEASESPLRRDFRELRETAREQERSVYEGSATVLDSLLRGFTKQSRPHSGSISSGIMKSAIDHGLLADSLPWLEAVLAAHKKKVEIPESMLQSAVDEDGNSLLELGLFFGCSIEIIEYLICHGAPVTEVEIKLAARLDQPDLLRIMLQNSLYKEGMIDLTTCSLPVVKVLKEASIRQESQQKAMRKDAKSFFVSFIQKLLPLGLASRHNYQKPDLYSRSIASTLVGNAMFTALERKENYGSPKALIHEEADSDGLSELASQGLMRVLPDEVVGHALVEDTGNATSLFLFIEDYLCSKEINDSATGLTLLLTIMEKFPSICLSSEVERYGFTELVSSHDALASNRLAELSARVTERRTKKRQHKISEEKLSESDVLASSGVVLCPKNHAACLHVTRHSSFRCDLCGRGVECGRVMHGCRECDWDACEKCTDKGEGGIAKWTHISELAIKCQRLMSGEKVNQDAFPESTWTIKLAERLASLNNTSDVNNLSIRILQRDSDSLKDLQSMLYTPGEITMHQFLGVILPALHSALLGRSHGLDRVGFRKKKQRTTGTVMKSSGEFSRSDSEEDRTQFAKELLKHLTKNETSLHDSIQHEDEELSESNHGDDEASEDEASGVSRNGNRKARHHTREQTPELLRRLHQVLTLYENVTSLRNSPSSQKLSSLQSLTTPVEISLTPVNLECRKKEKRSPSQGEISILAEPLVSLKDLSMQVFRACKVSNPYWTSYCQGLATDSAVIVDRAKRGSNQSMRIAKVVSFDVENGWHTVKYACDLNNIKDNAKIKLKDIDSIKQLKFEDRETKLVLAAREFFILFRHPSLDHHLSETLVRDASFGTKYPSFAGMRVESNCALASEWLPCTILKVEAVDKTTEQNRIQLYTLISDEGEVFCDVPAGSIRGLISSNTNSSSERGNAQNIEDQIRRSFPSFGRPGGRERSDSSSSDQASKRVLKRTWSALSLAESMHPMEVDRQSVKEWECQVGNHVLGVDKASLESPPELSIEFTSNQELQSPLLLTDQSEKTLLSVLWQLHGKDEQHVLTDGSQQMQFSFNCKQKEASDYSMKLRSHANLPTSKGVRKGYSSPNERLVEIENEPSRRSGKRKSGHAAGITDVSMNMLSLSSYGLDEICVQCMEIIGFLADASTSAAKSKCLGRKGENYFENKVLSRKLKEELGKPLLVVGGALPDWCFIAPAFSPQVFSYKVRKLLLERAAFGVSRSTLCQQESKVNVGRLRQRMAALRARAVELVGEAFSGGAEDPTALQLQADELYGMEEALSSRVKAAFRAEKWQEHSLQVAKAAINRDHLISDAVSVMDQYAKDDRIFRRRLEIRFDGESGFDAASGDEAGVTRGFYADIAEALLSCDMVAGVTIPSLCPDGPGMITAMALTGKAPPCRLPLWIPDVDISGQVIIPTPRADPNSGIGVFPRPLSPFHPQFADILKQFRFMGRLFAAAMRDGFMFPLPLSSSFLKLVQNGGDRTIRRPCLNASSSLSASKSDSDAMAGHEILLSSGDLPRPGFLGGEVFAVENYICRALDRVDRSDPPLTKHEKDRRYQQIAKDKEFLRIAFGKKYDCSFEEYFQDRTFVDPLDPTQGKSAAPLCALGHERSVTIHNIRAWVALSKTFILRDGIIAQALAFRNGVEDFFAADYLRLFMPEELQSDVCGVGDNVDNWTESEIRNLFKLDGGKGAAEALVAVAAIGGEGGAALSRRFGPSSPTIGFVVKALLEATPKMRRQFLSFVTSVPIVTPGLIEVVPVVSPSGDFLPMHDPGCLPRANTCARRLYLPRFDNYETFSQVLWTVIKQEAKFKGFYEWRGS